MVDLAQLDDKEGKWKTQRIQTRISRKPKMVVKLKLDVGKSRKKSKIMKKSASEVASSKQPTLGYLIKGRKGLFYH